MVAVCKERGDVGRPGAVRGWAGLEGWGLVKETQVPRMNDSETSGLQDVHCNTHDEVGVTPEHG